MKILLFICFIVVSVSAAPPSSNKNTDKDAYILTLENNNNGIDQYNYKLETSNDIKQEENGQIVPGATVPGGQEESTLKVQGKFSFKGSDDVVYTVTYIADENGFQPQGAHLPVAP